MTCARKHTRVLSRMQTNTRAANPQAAFQLRQEEERKAALAAREAAKETQKRILQELAAARAAANDARRSCIEGRLREAMARRTMRLEMVKERAALFAGACAGTRRVLWKGVGVGRAVCRCVCVQLKCYRQQHAVE